MGKKKQSKKTPPKNLELNIQQSNNRRALARQKLFKATNPKLKSLTRRNDPRKTMVAAQPTGKRSPNKKTKNANKDIQFEWDTSLSLSSEPELERKTQSPKKPAAKKLDAKKTPEEFHQECSRSTRTRTSANISKFPIKKIYAQTIRSKNVICQVQIVRAKSQTNTENTPIGGTHTEVVSLSSSVECTEIQMDTLSPEQVRADMEEVCDSSVKKNTTTT